MSNFNSEGEDGESTGKPLFTKKEILRLIFISGFVIFLSLSIYNGYKTFVAHSGGDKIDISSIPLKDPYLTQAIVTNNPFVRSYGTSRLRDRSIKYSDCNYEFSYKYLDKSYNGVGKDTVSYNIKDPVNYGCTPKGASINIFIEKGDPSTYYFRDHGGDISDFTSYSRLILLLGGFLFFFLLFRKFSKK